jgi:hypothetical protein
MSRICRLAAITAVVSLALAGVALAAVTKVTGGTTQITMSAAVASALTANHLTVTPLTPSTASGDTFSFPISTGRLNPTNHHGVIQHRGGLAITNGTRTVRFRHPTLVSNRHGAFLFALARTPVSSHCVVAARHLGRRCVIVTRLGVVRIARFTKVSISNGTATATVKLTAFSARVINRLAGRHIANPGSPIGTVTITPTLG